MALLRWCCWKHQEMPLPSIQDDDAEEEENIGDLKRFSLQELLDATNCFSNENKVGEGGFGTVYRGRIVGGLQVAIKRLEREVTSGVALMFKAELRMISTPTHPNLLRLLGFCITPTERLLVYPYMVNGSVRSWLKRESSEPLPWSLRKRIALGSAKGLAYLHHQCNPKIIHRDVKAANILLDECFEAVVGDFGLARLMDHHQTHVTTAVRGTIGHIAPEYFHSGVASEKTDVYGYGVLLLELITGLDVIHLNQMAIDEDVTLFDWVKGFLVDGHFESLVDPHLQGNFLSNEVMYMTQIALLCTRGSPRYRPPMSEVVRMLEREHLDDDWKEWWQKWETPLELVQLHLQPDQSLQINAIQDSTANLTATELSGPR